MKTFDEDELLHTRFHDFDEDDGQPLDAEDSTFVRRTCIVLVAIVVIICVGWFIGSRS